MGESVWRLPQPGVNLAVLADCQIHDGGPQLPPALFPRLEGVDLIVTLGDMGEKAGLDRLQEIAPVIGVQGEDDAADLRTRRPSLLLVQGRHHIGCVFDAKAVGLAASVDPFVATDDWRSVSNGIFGCAVDVLLHAGTRRADEAKLGLKGSALNPGSAVLPAEDSRPTFLRLKVTDDGCYGQIIWVA